MDSANWSAKCAKRVPDENMLTILSLAAIVVLLVSAYQLGAHRRGSRTAWTRVAFTIAAWAAALWLATMIAMFIFAISNGV